MGKSSKTRPGREVPANRHNIATRFLELGFGQGSDAELIVLEKFFSGEVIVIIEDFWPGSNRILAFKQGSPWSKVCNSLCSAKKYPDKN